MESDKAFQFALILAWEDLMKVSKPCSARVEYLCEPGTALDYVSVWSVRASGQQDLVCDYWTWPSSAHPSGVRFRNGYCSDQLARMIDLIMNNPDQFTRGLDACRHGLVLIHPPTREDRTEAVTWMAGIQGIPSKVNGHQDELVHLSTQFTSDRTPESEVAVTATK